MTDSKKIDLLLKKMDSMEGKMNSMEKKLNTVETEIGDLKKGIKKLETMDTMILDEVERVHKIMLDETKRLESKIGQTLTEKVGLPLLSINYVVHIVPSTFLNHSSSVHWLQ